MSVNVCVPVLRRYDKLTQLLASLRDSTVIPDCVYVIDNGRNSSLIDAAFTGCSLPFVVYTPDTPLGVAESWNWFLRHVPEERIICNDDIQFSPDSIQTIVDTPGDLVFMNNCGFSCLLVRDRCVELVGEFDETISPGYAYYEDVDYAYRMIKVAELRFLRIDAGIIHDNSSTWQAGSDGEIKEHWRKFFVAKSNFEKKWGVSVESLAGIV